MHSFERWDGHGAPRGTKGEATPLPTRLATLAFAAVMFDAVAGRPASIDAVKRWSERIIDPSLAQAFLQAPDDCLDAASLDDAWEAAVAMELGQPRLVGHSSGVAHLAELAGRQLGVDEPSIKTLRWAGLLHDIGRCHAAALQVAREARERGSQASVCPHWTAYYQGARREQLPALAAVIQGAGGRPTSVGSAAGSQIAAARCTRQGRV